MMRVFVTAALALVSVACSDPKAGDEAGDSTPRRVATTRGAAIVLSRDERIAVATHRDLGAVSVLRLDPKTGAVASSIEVDAGEGSVPVAAVFGADDDTAYVLLQGARAVMKLTNLRSGAPKSAGTVLVGAEPTALAITPSGATLFVANFGDGTLSIVTTTRFLFGSNPDLNLALASTGLLGDLVRDDDRSTTPSAVWTAAELQNYRPALAHPRALAMTDDGDEDDADETLYVTEFFSQPLLGVPEAGDYSHVDRNQQGVVYPIEVSTGQLSAEGPIFIAPARTGFSDSEGRMTSCIPNQLHSAAIDGSRLLVTSVCASPRGPTGLAGMPSQPANFKTVLHGAVFSIDTTANSELPGQATLMTDLLQKAYDEDASSEIRMPLIPNDIAAATAGGEGSSAYVTALGADAVFRIDYDAGGEPLSIGSKSRRFIDLHPPQKAAGRLPRGIVLSRKEPFALVVNESSQNVSTLSLASDVVTSVAALAKNEMLIGRIDPAVANGRRLFTTGLGAWSLGGQAWSSCESCHPDGQSDGLTWLFPRGPRRTISTAGTYVHGRAERRMLLWTANIDEVHDVEAIARGVSGGVGGVLWRYNDPTNECRLIYDGSTVPVDASASCMAAKATTNRLNGLNGSLVDAGTGTPCAPEDTICDVNAADDWNDIDAFLRTIEAPPRATQLNPAYVASGHELFLRAGCNACHGGPGYTISRVFYRPNLVNSGKVPSTRPADAGSVVMDELRGRLRLDEYTATSDLVRALNPPVASGRATFRSWAPAGDTPENFLDYLYGNSDQINCVLRAVGTFPPQTTSAEPNFTGIVAPGAPPVSEVRQPIQMDGSEIEPTLALGQSGFNVPSLVGLAVGAPYLHAGNARTLEELFDPTFKAHYQAIDPTFLENPSTRAENVRDLVSYLLSLDEAAASTPDPLPPATSLGFEPDLCAQFQDSTR